MGVLTGNGPAPGTGGGSGVLGNASYHLALGPVSVNSKKKKKEQEPKPQEGGLLGAVKRALPVAKKVGEAVLSADRAVARPVVSIAQRKPGQAFNQTTQLAKNVAKVEPAFQTTADVLARTLPGGQNDIKAENASIDSANRNHQIIEELRTAGRITNKQASRLHALNQQSYETTGKNVKGTQESIPSSKEAAAAVGGIAADVLSAGTLPGLGAGTATLQAGRLGRVGERAAGNAFMAAGKQAAAAGILSGSSSAAQQEASTGKVDLKRTAADTALGAALGGLDAGFQVRGANKAELRGIESRKAASAKQQGVSDLISPKQSTRLLGPGTEAINRRISAIDEQLRPYTTGGQASTVVPADKNLKNLGADIRYTGSKDQFKFNKNRTGGEITTAKQTNVGAVTSEEQRVAQTKSADELRALVRERKQLQSQLDDLSHPRTLQNGSVGTTEGNASTVDAALPAKNTSTDPSGALASADTKTPIPEASGAKTAYRKVVNSVSTQLTKDGAAPIANGLERMRDLSETGQSAFLSKIPTVRKLNKQEFTQFVDHLEAGADKAKSGIVNPRVLQAADEWQKAIPEVRQRATAAGLNVGDLGPTYFPRNYQDALKTKSGFNRAVDHLVKTGQATDSADAIHQLRFVQKGYRSPFGHFENTRQLDLPGYDKTKNALVNYVAGAHHAIAHAETFGPEGEHARDVIANLRKTNPDAAERAFKNYLIGTGQYDFKGPEELHKIAGGIRSFNRLRALGLSAILNAGQTVNTATVSGAFRTATSALKLLSPKEREYVHDTGVILDSVLQNLREGQGIQGKITGKLTAPGFNTVERFNRSVAAEAGKSWANKLAKKAAGGNKRAEAVLRSRLGVEGDIGKKLTKEQQIQASRELVKKTQFKVDPQDLPGWASSPEGKLISQFRTFTYKQTGFILNNVLKEATKGNVAPLVRFLSVGIPAGYLSGKVRGTINSQDNSTDSDTAKLLSALQNVGAFGVGGDALFLAQSSQSSKLPQYITGTLGGPTAQYAQQTEQNVSEAIQGQSKDLQRQGYKTIPVAGSRLANTQVPYGTKTSQSVKSADKSVSNELSRIGYSPGDTNRSTGRAAKLSDEQYNEYIQKSSQIFAKKTKKAMNDPSYKSLSPADKKATLSANLGDSRKQVLNGMIGKPKTRTVAKKYKRY